MAKINHNETDYNSYQKLMERRRKLFAEKEQETRQENINENLHSWLSSVPKRYKNADLSLFKRSVSLGLKIRPQELSAANRIVLTGALGAGRTFFAYSLLKEYLKLGLITPQGIRIAGIREAAEGSIGGFQKQEWRDNFFSKKAQIYVITGLSEMFAESGNRGNDRFWGEFTQFVNERKIPVIFIYENSSKEEKEYRVGGEPAKPPTFIKQYSLLMSLFSGGWTLRYINPSLRTHVISKPKFKLGE